jgi:hypothetical protein
MNETIKIWKSNWQGVLEEVVSPVYLFGASATSNGQIPMTMFCVSVAAFNNEGQVCELRIPQPFGPALLAGERESVRGESTGSRRSQKAMHGLEHEVRDRLIGSEPLAGTL